MQPEHTGPAQACQHLPVVPQAVWRSDHLRISTRQVAILLEPPTIEDRRNTLHVRRRKVPPRTEQFCKDIEPARHRDPAGRSRRQNQTTAPPRILVSELLRQPATLRDAKHIHLLLP